MANTQMFQKYRTQLSALNIKTVAPECVICPLCWQEKNFGDMSLEHVVPQAIGGKAKILTCRRCNNEHGRTLDAGPLGNRT